MASSHGTRTSVRVAVGVCAGILQHCLSSALQGTDLGRE
jgi:threonine/homoserine/homoserine lactone efflux protein